MSRIKTFIKAQAGDTFVEVLFCVAVISAVMLASYASINHAYLSFQETQERARAVKLVESQVEDLSASFRSNPTGFSWTASDYCFLYNGSTVIIQTNPSNCNLASDGTSASPGSVPTYAMSIVLTGQTYKVTATWNGVGNHLNDTASMEYRTQ